ncbi:endolytic transglycosylase MltG [Antribacter gilvus]|uniref:endolytic transglycosylase MltG n=1 Tax=Antribacter gilvus TaxID=2304675 RepID=UPI000F7A2CD2|nr:endolytic transglycosylase MltG [Antribacter gilvus]
MTDLLSEPTVSSGPPRHASGGLSGASPREQKAAKRRKRRRTIVTLLVTLLVVVAAGGGAAFEIRRSGGILFGWATPFAPDDYAGPGTGEVAVEIPDGAGGWDMARVLADAGVVASAEAFVRAFEANPGSGSIQAGSHLLMKEMSAADAVETLTRNEVDRAGLVVPEGFTVAQVTERMIGQGWPQADVEAALADPAALGLPPEAGGNLEGWIYPNTYEAKPDTTSAAQLLTEMVAATVAELTELGVPAEQRQQVLVKASIVEREAPDQFRGQVARVIENRLATSEVLGMDAIESYYAGKPAHEMTRAELADTTSRPFNSRRMDGLPPTAIGSPGRASIEAVLDPPPGPWIYYVTVNLHTQETKFTDRVEEFEVFKDEYQAWAAENGY